MGTKDTRIDTYIGKSADFAKPILNRLRKLVHAGCPDVEETLKWGHPSFMYRGILCGIAAFKEHCTFGFWKGSLIVGNNKGKTREAMGQFGRLTKLSELPADTVLIGYVKEAVKLNDAGVKLPARARPKERKPLVIPTYFKSALKKNKKALSMFQSFNYGNKKEYIEWITEAKTQETRERRLEMALEWMSEGKIRNWKYVRK